jgi:hypothetical protein
VMVTGAVVLSSQTTSTRAANLLASAIILPMSLVTIVESLIIINVHQRFILWYVAVGMFVIVILLIRTGVKIFNREELLGRAVDELNIRHFVKNFWYHYIDATPSELEALRATGGFSLRRWYRRVVFPALNALSLPLKVMVSMMLVTFIGGWIWGMTSAPTVEISDNDVLYRDFANAFTADLSLWDNFVIAFYAGRGALVIGGISLLSFGLPSASLLILPMGYLGYMLGAFTKNGVNPLAFILIVLPSALFFIPALVLSYSASLRAGASVIAPPENVTVGTIWMRSIADFFKIFVGITIPLLILGGLANYLLTPLVADLVVAVF